MVSVGVASVFLAVFFVAGVVFAFLLAAGFAPRFFFRPNIFLVAFLLSDKVFYSNNGADNADYGKQNNAADKYPEHIIGICRQDFNVIENKVNGKGDAAGEKYL